MRRWGAGEAGEKGGREAKVRKNLKKGKKVLLKRSFRLKSLKAAA
jgi:hypothetical protein